METGNSQVGIRMRHQPVRVALMVLFGTLLLIGCGEDNPNPTGKPKFGASVKGKVLHKGKPVPFGVVLVYDPEHATNMVTRAVTPSARAYIQPDGSFSLRNVPVGILSVAVVTDPDTDLTKLMRPTGGMGPEGPGKGGPGEKGPGGPPMPKDAPQPKMPNRPSKPKKMGPMTTDPSKLTKEEVTRLKKLHETYGTLETSPLSYHILEGEQTLDIVLE